MTAHAMKTRKRKAWIYLLPTLEMVGGVLLYPFFAPIVEIILGIRINMDTWVVVCIILASIHCGKMIREAEEANSINDG